ncbi:MAG: hypothetical protein ABL961_02215, partial [Vicinamibacterales bacterium]
MKSNSCWARAYRGSGSEAALGAAGGAGIIIPGRATPNAELGVGVAVGDNAEAITGFLSSFRNASIAVLRDMASVGLTSREACGDTVRNVMGCHLAGACPYEALDISPWAEAAFQHFLHHPLSQRLPRKFKINFSGCETDCGQAMFNDVGVIATTRTLDDGTREAGFRVFVAGGLGANPHPALALEEFTSRDDLMATLEAILRVFSNHGNRDNKLRARMKWLVDTMGWDDLQAR